MNLHDRHNLGTLEVPRLCDGSMNPIESLFYVKPQVKSKWINHAYRPSVTATLEFQGSKVPDPKVSANHAEHCAPRAQPGARARHFAGQEQP